jgi:Fe2+ transport system protein FeoA
MTKLLTNLKINETGEFVSSEDYKNVQKRLADLGLTPGTQISLLKKGLLRGPVEILVKNSRLVLGRGVAEKILVNVEDNE